MRLVICCAVAVLCVARASGDNQLYTGDPATVPPGVFQFQLYYDGNLGRESRIAKSSLTRGITRNTEFKASYGYYWNFVGPDISIGPTVGAKWRFIGNGRTNPSVALSAIYVINQDVAGRARKNDAGAAILASYPIGRFSIYANLGRVLVGENAPDLRYTSLAVTRLVSKRVLTAVEYSAFRRLGSGPSRDPSPQFAFGTVLGVREKWSYSAQVGYLPEGQRIKWHTTLGVSVSF